LTLRPIIFEDHTSAALRPLSWSVPVYELRCGLLNLRERVAVLTGREPEVLPRGFLAPLARDCGHAVAGTTGPRRLLVLNARLGAAWEVLAALLAAAESGADWCWRDDDGVLAACLEGAAGDAFLADWRTWDDEAVAGGGWADPETSIHPFSPALPGRTPALPAAGESPLAWRRIWDLVPALARALAGDVVVLADRGMPPRRPWGAVPEAGRTPAWAQGSALRSPDLPGVHLLAAARLLVADGVRVAPGVVIDASKGPVVLDRGVEVLPHAYLEGPLYLGAGTVVKPGARLAECSIGAVCKVAGEIGESTLLDLVNKQHDGFIGHAYLGSWVNLGAMTTCSDLKNNYGRIRVDVGAGEEDTGLRFLGLMMAEHGKTAIGTLFNTGTSVGFASNVFAVGFPPKSLANFTWGDGRGSSRQDPARAAATAAVAMGRRGCCFGTGHDALFAHLGGVAAT
jgi:UDP-N-acetylglucosamine diphosphorylase/glucosamine-1-phosphate N-acetyltransferase